MLNRLEEIEGILKAGTVKKIAVAMAADQDIMELVKELEQRKLARFLLIGDERELQMLLEKNGILKETVEVLHCPDARAAAGKAVEAVRNGECSLVMKGNLHTSVFLRAVLDKAAGLNTGRLLSQITVYNRVDAPGVQLMTDCAMAISPGLKEKKEIIDNAVELMRKLGYDCPKVAAVSALEVINPEIPDTIDAAVLSKMNDRGQIKNCIVDGPFALDNAVSKEAARHKNIHSPVAGQADILLLPNLQVANCLFKSLLFFAKMDTASVIMGAGAPVVMTSRTDTVKNKLLSIMLSMYLADKPQVS